MNDRLALTLQTRQSVDAHCCCADEPTLWCVLAHALELELYTANSNTRNRISGTTCTENAVSCMLSWGCRGQLRVDCRLLPLSFTLSLFHTRTALRPILV
eukprot:1569763-Rhodomonas_salina.2